MKVTSEYEGDLSLKRENCFRTTITITTIIKIRKDTAYGNCQAWEETE